MAATGAALALGIPLGLPKLRRAAAGLTEGDTAEWLEVLHASTNQADGNFRGTSGSMSVATLYDPLRQAAATLREMLRAEAARMLEQPADALMPRDGGFELPGDP